MKLVVYCGRRGRQCAFNHPVKVNSVKGNKTVETYSFLDPGSTATFCTEELMQDLKVTGRRPTSFLVLWVRKGQLVHMLSWDWKSVAWMRMISWSFFEFTHKRKYRSNRKIFCSNQMLIDGHI